MANWVDGLKALVDLRCAALSGAQKYDAANRIGGLGALCWDERGWRSDWLMATRRYLGELLVGWEADSDFKPYRNLDRSDVVGALKLHWGITRSPHSANEVIGALGLNVSEDTISDWHHKVIGTADRHIAVMGDFDQPVPPLPTGGPRLWLRPNGNYPWPDRTGDEAALDALVREAFARLSVQPTEAERKFLLRGLTAVRASVWFGAGKPGPGYNCWRQLTFDAIAPWARTNLIPLEAPALSGGNLTSGSHYRAAVAATVQMVMFEVAHDATALRNEFKVMRFRVTEFNELARQFSYRMEEYTNPAARLKLESVTHRRSAVALVISSALVGRQVVTDAAAVSSADGLLALAYSIRDEADLSLRRRLISTYLDARPRVLESASSDHDHLSISLADQSVGFDCVVAESDKLVRRMAKQLLEHPARGRIGYIAHAFRDRAVLSNKRNRFSEGAQAVLAGEKVLRDLRETGDLTDWRETYESGHQVWLCAAGIHVRRLEKLLDSGLPNAIALAAREALTYSALAVTAFDELMATGELTQTRHAGGYIATVGWEFQSRLIRLRVALAVRLALDAKVVTAKRIMSFQSRADGEPLAPPQDTWAGEITDGAMAEAYRTLVRIRDQHSRPPVEFVRVALSLAFLFGGKVPTEEKDGGILSTLHFLDAPPSETASGISWGTVDILGAARWLEDRDTDVGPMAYYEPRTRVYQALALCSGGAFESFRAIQWQPKERSHD